MTDKSLWLLLITLDRHEIIMGRDEAIERMNEVHQLATHDTNGDFKDVNPDNILLFQAEYSMTDDGPENVHRMANKLLH